MYSKFRAGGLYVLVNLHKTFLKLVSVVVVVLNKDYTADFELFLALIWSTNILRPYSLPNFRAAERKKRFFKKKIKIRCYLYIVKRTIKN